VSESAVDHIVALIWENRHDEAVVLLHNSECPVATAMMVGLMMASRPGSLAPAVALSRHREGAH